MPDRRTEDSDSRPYREEPVPIKLLDLDPNNPRLSADEEGLSQDALLQIMVERFKIDDLAESIIAAGFRNFDPIVGWREGDRVVVREGNRRVATVKLLVDPSRAAPKYRAKWTDLAARLPADVLPTLDNLLVRVYANRDDPDVTAYIGFRHVTGVLTWPALEKAEFIARLVEKEKWPYDQIAERLGSYARHVERHYVAYRIVQLATEERVAGSRQLRNAFGVLLRALQASGVSQFLGVEYPGDPAASSRPVPADRMADLADFVAWTFGTDDKPRLLPDSRRLTDWGQILQSAEAVSYLRRTASPTFERAFFKSGGQAKSVADALFTAADRLEESVPLVSEMTSNGDVTEAIGQVARFLAQILKHFPAVGAKYGWRD